MSIQCRGGRHNTAFLIHKNQLHHFHCWTMDSGIHRQYYKLYTLNFTTAK